MEALYAQARPGRLFAPQCWGGEVCRGSQARGVAGGEAHRPPLLEDSVLPWEEGCGLEADKGGFPTTGFPQRKMRSTLSQLHLDDSCRAPVTAEGEPTGRARSQESALQLAQGCTGNEAEGWRVAVAPRLRLFSPKQRSPPDLLQPCAPGTLIQVTQLRTGTEGFAPYPGSSPEAEF